jgi:ketosteroid isomerase-like protein
MSAEDVAVAQLFFDALESAARSGDRDRLYPLLSSDVEWQTPLRTLHGVRALQDEPGWPWAEPRPAFDVGLEDTQTVDLGDGRVVADFREVYRMKDSGDFAYERKRQIELTIRDEKVARYELRFGGS